MMSLLYWLFRPTDVSLLAEQAAAARLKIFLQAFRPLVYAYVCYIAVYYMHLSFQIVTRNKVKRKVWRKRKADAEKHGDKLDATLIRSASFMRRDPLVITHPSVIRADRAVENQLEQFPAFFISSMMYSLLVDSYVGALLVFAYTGLRAMYAPLYHNVGALRYVTGPSYTIIAYMILHSVASIAFI